MMYYRSVWNNIDACFLYFLNFRFLKRVPNGCAYSTGVDYSTALLLSVFLGWLGIDRIYLGYYAIGLKLTVFLPFLNFLVTTCWYKVPVKVIMK